MHKILKNHLLVFALICAYFAAVRFFEIGCPVKALVGVPCPTCGMTRALVSLLKPDWKGYLSFHPMAAPVAASVFILIHQKVLKRKTLRRVLIALCIAVLVGNFCFYLLKIL